MWFFATLEDIERILYQIDILGKSSLKVVVAGRKPNCYLCRVKIHMRMQHPKYKLPQAYVKAVR